jgi:hypothetical protein
MGKNSCNIFTHLNSYPNSSGVDIHKYIVLRVYKRFVQCGRKPIVIREQRAPAFHQTLK